MRKIFLLALIGVLLAPLTAFGWKTDNITDGILRFPEVKDARVITAGDNCVVAVKTAPLFFKKDIADLKIKLKTYAEENSRAREVYVTFDLDIFLKADTVVKKRISAANKLDTVEDVFYLINLIEERIALK